MHRRVTLVNSPDRSREWLLGHDTPGRIVFASSFKVLRYALQNGVRDYEQDIERVIIDRTATPAEFLELLAHICDDFPGDIVYAVGDGSAYLSSIGRGGHRVLYAMREADLRFYLETHGLLVGGTESSSVAAA